MIRMAVDTDVYSFVLKDSPEAQRFTEPLRECQIVLSFQTVAEALQVDGCQKLAAAANHSVGSRPAPLYYRPL